MGLYDRGYYHDEDDDAPRPYAEGAGVADTMVAKIIILTVALWIPDALSAREPVLQPWLCLQGDMLFQPLQYYRFLTAGFVHNPMFPSHIVYMMFGLFMFGSSVERLRGPGELLRLYLGALLVGNLIWVAIATSQGWPSQMHSYGSDAAMAAVMVTLAVLDPYRIINVMFVLPTPMWLVATLYVAIDVTGAMRGGQVDGAFAASQVGAAAFGYLYAVNRWSLSSWLPTPRWFGRMKWPSAKDRRRSRSDLKVYAPADDEEDVAKALEAEVDRILRKINRDGEASLTKTERATLERASRKYRNR